MVCHVWAQAPYVFAIVHGVPLMWARAHCNAPLPLYAVLGLGVVVSGLHHLRVGADQYAAGLLGKGRALLA